MIDISLNDLKNADFVLPEGNPILRPFDRSFVVADPSLLTPEMCHDGKWHMFFHTNFGVYHFDSPDGISFSNAGKVCSRAMRPNINFIDGRYYLFYERTRPLIANALNVAGLADWYSEIYCRESEDLYVFGDEYPVICHTKDFEASKKCVALSNPFLIHEDGVFRLWYSCGQTYIKDCGFSEPTYINYAESDRVSSGYVTNDSPVISPDPENPYLNLCSGCIKIYRLKDGYAALQNGIYEKDGKSHSAIILLSSQDGVSFTHEKILVEPGMYENADWMKQYVYASHMVKYGGEIRIYFNARNMSDMLRGRECIGYVKAVLT